MAAALARDGVPSVDLAAHLVAAPADAIDRGHDGTHHGPRVNRLIAEAVGQALSSLPLPLDAPPC